MQRAKLILKLQTKKNKQVTPPHGDDVIEVNTESFTESPDRAPTPDLKELDNNHALQKEIEREIDSLDASTKKLKAQEFYKKACAMTLSKENHPIQLDYLQTAIRYFESIKPYDAEIHQGLLGSYTYINLIQFKLAQSEEAKNSYKQALEHAKELKELKDNSLILAHLHYSNGSLYGYLKQEVESKPIANKYLSQAIQCFQEAIECNPQNVLFYFSKACLLTNKSEICSASSYEETIRSALACLRLGNQVYSDHHYDYGHLTSDQYPFINHCHSIKGSIDSTKNAILNLQDVINAIDTKYKTTHDSKMRTLLLESCTVMIELYNNQTLWKNAGIGIDVIIKTLLLRIKLNKEIDKELNKVQISEDSSLYCRLVAEKSKIQSSNATIVPLFKEVIEEKSPSSKQNEILDLITKTKELDPEAAEEIIENIMRIMTQHAEKKPDDKYALKNLQFYVKFLETSNDTNEFAGYLANAYVLLGRAYFKSNDYANSLTYFTKAIDSKEADNVTSLYLYRAKTYEKQHQYSLAIADCDQIIAMGDPDTAAARFKITLLQQEKSRKKKAASTTCIPPKAKERPEKKSIDAEQTKVFQVAPDKACESFKTASDHLKKGEQMDAASKAVLAEIALMLSELKSAHSKTFQPQLDSIKKRLNDSLTLLKRYEKETKEIKEKMDVMCASKNVTVVQNYLKKSTDIIDKCPKKYNIMQDALDELQSVKLNVLQIKEKLAQEKSERERAHQLKLQEAAAEKNRKKLAQQQKKIKQSQEELKPEQLQKEKKEKQERRKKKLDLAQSQQAAIEEEKEYKLEKEKADAINKASLKKEEEAKKVKEIEKRIFDYTENVIPHTGLKILFEFKDTLKRHNATIVVGGSSAYKIGLNYAAIMAEDEKKLALFKTIEVNDNDIAVQSKKIKPLDKSTTPPVETALLSLQFESTPLFKRKERDTPYPKIFTNFLAEIKTNQGTNIVLDATVKYPGYPNPHNDLIPLATIKCYFSNKKHPTLPSIEIGDLQFLIINDPKGIIQAAFASGMYDYVLPDPDDTTEIPKGIFARGFGFYLKMDGILSPGPEAQKMLKSNHWAHYYFARHYFAKTESEDHIQSCYKEMAQLIRKKSLFSKKELNETIVALSNIALLNSNYKHAEHYDLIKENKQHDGKPIADYCAAAKLTEKAQKIADFLQAYYKDNMKTLTFAELFPLLVKNPHYLDQPDKLLKRIENLVDHPIHIATLQELIERNEFSKQEHHELLAHYLENFLFTKLKQSIPLDKMSEVAEKLAHDLQLYYKITPCIFTPPSLNTVLDRMLLYPELLESKQNSILLLDKLRTISYDDSVTYITSLLQRKLAFADTKPFLEMYCDHIIKTDSTLASLTSEEKAQLQVNLALFIYHYFQQMTPGIPQLNQLLTHCSLKSLASSSADDIIIKWVQPQVAFYKKRAELSTQSSPLYCGPCVQESYDAFVYLDSKDIISQTPSPPLSSGRSDYSPQSIPSTPEYKKNQLTRSPPLHAAVRTAGGSPIHTKKIHNSNTTVPILKTPKTKVRT